MRISYTTVDLSRRFGEAGAIRALAAAGFDAFDMAFMDLSSPMFGEGWRQHTAHLAETARRAGIVCNQAHAPYPTHRAETEENRPYNDRILDHVLRSMEAAAMLGAPCIVVHPWHHRPYAENAEVLFSENMEFYRSLAPYAKAFGIRIAIENMWQRRDGRSGPIVDSVCAPPKELARYLDALGDSVFTACLDLGHCGLCGHDGAEAIRTLGGRLGALHVHDNDGISDRHVLPGEGRANWESILQALSDVGYRGDFTFEAHGFTSPLPDGEIPDALVRMRTLGQAMAARL